MIPLILIMSTFLKIISSQVSSTYIPKTVDGDYCAIPFEYRGTLYNDCITAGADKPWCSLEKVYISKISKWGNCIPRENQETSLYIPKTVNGDFCAIPFVYKDITYHDCIPQEDRFWCSLDKIFVNGQSKWDYCVPKPKVFDGCLLGTPNVTLNEVEEILRKHNNIRAQVSAEKMAKLEWNSELAQRAQAAANTCSFKHVEKMLCGNRYEGGQNFHYNTWDKDYPAQTTWSNVINFWFQEGNDYSIDTMTCVKDKICMHYTQLVWDKSAQIGCGKAYCYSTMFENPNNLQYSIQYFCNYYESGNIQGMPPYVVSKGQTCQNCFTFDSTRKFRCDSDKLCEACQNDMKDCVGLDDLKRLSESGMICSDTSLLCEFNKNLCNIDKSSLFLPPSFKEIINNCKKTCNRC